MILRFNSLFTSPVCLLPYSICRWLEVLRCISRWELLQQIASGMPTDAVLFAGAAAGTPGVEKGLGKAGAAIKDQFKRLGAAAGAGAPAAAADMGSTAGGCVFLHI